jgi:hypothetical protein
MNDVNFFEGDIVRQRGNWSVSGRGVMLYRACEREFDKTTNGMVAVRYGIYYVRGSLVSYW